jgi:DNA-binding SARP family transcriptional activator
MAFALHLLGEFHLTDDEGQERALPASKARCVLAYLAFQPYGVASRSQLMERLWSRHGRKQAQTSLRQTLLRLRYALTPNDPPVLHRDAGTLRLDLERIRVDALDLERCQRLSEMGNTHDTLTAWSGELLTDTNPRDPEFETWLSNKRYELKLHRENLIIVELETAERKEAWSEVRQMALELLRTEPAHEGAYRSLIRLAVAEGNPTEALRHYETLKERLSRDYGAPPADSTEQLISAVRQSTLGSRAAGPSKKLAPRTGSDLGLTSPAAAFARATDDVTKVAILPIRSLDPNGKQHAHLWDGVVEDIRTTLTYFRSFSVVSGSVTRMYDDRTDAIQALQTELGVDYALEGSVRVYGEHAVLNTQLIKCAQGTQVWTHRVSFQLDELHTLHEDIAASLVVHLDQSLTESELEFVRSKPASNMRAFDYWARANLLNRDWTTASDEASVRWLRKAIEADENYARAYCNWAGVCNTRRFLRPDRPEVMQIRLEQAMQLAGKAVALDPADARSRVALGWAMLHARKFDSAQAQFSKALDLNPYDTDTLIAGAVASCYLGNDLVQGVGATVLAERAVKLCPMNPGFYAFYHSIVLYFDRRLEDAIEVMLPIADSVPDGNAWLAATFAELKRKAEARQAADTFVQSVKDAATGLMRTPEVDPLAWFWEITPLRRAEDQHRLENALEVAGLPTLNPQH